MRIVLVMLMVGTSLTCMAQSSEDKAAIKTAAINYVEGFYNCDTTKLIDGLHHDLVKRIVDNRSGKSVIQTVGRKELVDYAKTGQRMPDSKPSVPFKATVTIYDISNDIALAKVTTNKMNMFFDYLQLAKVDNQWKVINVLWAFYK